MTYHDLNYAEIDEKGEISGDEQLCLIYCETCGCHEWHWLFLDDIL